MIGYATDAAYNRDGMDGEKPLLWQRIKSNIAEKFDSTVYESWLSRINIVEMKDDVVTALVPSKFIRDWILNNYRSELQKCILEVAPHIKAIDLRVDNGHDEPLQQHHTTVTNPAPKTTIGENDNQAVSPIASLGASYNSLSSIISRSGFAGLEKATDSQVVSKLDPKLTFDTFVTGASNQVAFGAASAVAEGLYDSVFGKVLYIHGDVGMGKTHLLQAIAHGIQQREPAKKVAYLSAGKFMHHYVTAVRDNTLIAFREKLRIYDILLLDDIQFICGKQSTQQEFAHTFNDFIESGKMVVVTCSQSPYNLDIDNQVKSRLSAGVVAEIHPADYDLRLAIIKSKARELELDLGEGNLEFIAGNVSASIRELEASLKKIVISKKIANIDINRTTIKEIIKDTLTAHNKKISVQDVLNQVSGFFGVSATNIVSKSREAQFVHPRHVVAYIAKKHTTASFQDIGKHLGGRDHATVIHAIKSLEKKLTTDPQLVSDIEKIEKGLRV
jgi:chromosomal replication initiator protein